MSTKELVEAITNPEKNVVSPVVFPTGLTLLDQLVGGGQRLGHQSGDIIRLIGDTQAGKTYLIMEHIAAAYHKFGAQKFKWLYDNAEGGFSFHNADELWQMPVDLGVNVVTSNTAEESYYRAVDFYANLKDDEFGIFALDSLDGLIGKNKLAKLEAEKTAFIEGTKLKKKGEQRTEVQSFMSGTYFPGIVPYLNSTSPTRKNALFLFVSQMRADPTATFGGLHASGGNAARFYTDTVLSIKKHKTLNEKDDVFKEDRAVGGVIDCVLSKTRTPRPERKLYYTTFFNSGLSEIDTCIDYVFGLRPRTDTFKTCGNIAGGEKLAKVLWKGKEMTRQALIKKAVADYSIVEELQELANKTWEKVESSISVMRPRKYRSIVDAK